MGGGLFIHFIHFLLEAVSVEGRSSARSGSGPTFLDLLVVVGVHLLLDVLVDVVLEDVRAEPKAGHIDALLQVLHPVFSRLLAVDPPDADRHFLSALPAVGSVELLILEGVVEWAILGRHVFGKEEAFLQAAQLFFEQVQVSGGC